MDRLVRVNIANAARYLQMGQTAIDTEYKFSYSPDGTIAMRQMHPSPSPLISSLGIETAAEFLQNLFSTKSADPIRRMVEKAIVEKKGTFDALEDEVEVLYDICESIIDSLEDGSHIAKLILPGEPSISSPAVRYKTWTKMWQAVTATLPFIQNVKRYCQQHSNGITIPPQIWDMTGWSHGLPVALIERSDGTYQIRPATSEEQIHIKRPKAIDREGIVRSNRYLYLTKTQKQALGIGRELYAEGVNLKFTFDFAASDSFMVERLKTSRDKALPHMPSSPSKKWFDKRQVVQRHVTGPIILPIEFCRRYDIAKDDVVGTLTKKGKITVYGKKDFCSVCGDEHDRRELVTKPICGDCADALPKVTMSLQKNGSFSSAISAAKADLVTAMNKLNALEEGN